MIQNMRSSKSTNEIKKWNAIHICDRVYVCVCSAYYIRNKQQLTKNNNLIHMLY